MLFLILLFLLLAYRQDVDVDRDVDRTHNDVYSLPPYRSRIKRRLERRRRRQNRSRICFGPLLDHVRSLGPFDRIMIRMQGRKFRKFPKRARNLAAMLDLPRCAVPYTQQESTDGVVIVLVQDVSS